jgi:hypothetical protein
MSLKTIKVNPIFLSGSSSSGSKNKTRKEKPAGVSLNQSNSIKKKLIARIKNFQQKGTAPANGNDQPNNDMQPLNDVFGDSVQFLDNLARDKEEKKREKKNTSLKHKPTSNPYMNIATELPPELDWNTIAPAVSKQAQQHVQAQQPIIQPVQVQPIMPVQVEPMQAQWQAQPQPSYSNLKKGGTRPTYRTWLRTTQKQKPAPKQTINILEDVAIETEEPFTESTDHSISLQTVSTDHSISLQTVSADTISVNHSVSPDTISPDTISPTPEVSLNNTVSLNQTPQPSYTPSLKPKRKRITRTLKYKLGKHANGTVSVLIKNSQTRRKVQTEQALLKQKSILDIKNHLRSNNLLKAGSNAPSDVLRHLYEQSILAGQIENKAKDTLIHNYFNDEKK